MSKSGACAAMLGAITTFGHDCAAATAGVLLAYYYSIVHAVIK